MTRKEWNESTLRLMWALGNKGNKTLEERLMEAYDGKVRNQVIRALETVVAEHKEKIHDGILEGN